jgi:thiamine biosynthesis lipoprotein
MMGTSITIAVYSENSIDAEGVVAKAFEEMAEIEREMNYRRPQSELYGLNQSPSHQGGKVSPALFGIIRKSIHFSNLTNGAFDVTLLPLTLLWNDHLKKNKIPGSTKIRRQSSLVGYENLILNEQEGTIRFKKPGMMVDLGGIAKGYAVDRAIALLISEGVERAFVEAGGDLYTIGSPSDSEKTWPIGIKHPRNPDELILVINTSKEGIATSGNYHHSTIIEGRRCHHILDPRTGIEAKGMMSVTVIAEDTMTMSVTVIAEDTMTADVLATAGFALGPRKGIEVFNELDGVEWVLVTEQGDVMISNGLIGRTIPILKRSIHNTKERRRERDVY